MSETKPEIVVFHPSPFMVQTVDELLDRFAPDIEHKNIIVDDLLDRAQSGINEKIVQEVREIIRSAQGVNSPVILCSCSTLGGLAETIGKEIGAPVMRIDRAMAECAVRNTHHIAVVAAVESTMGPTSTLLREIAEEKGAEITIQEVLVPDAWAMKQKGDVDGYIMASAKTIKIIANEYDVIVLAQGSMAQAKEFCADISTPILTSPELGVKAAIALARKLAAQRN